jgi:hypothetical protein
MQEINTFVAAIQAAFSASVQDAVNTQVTARLVQHANIVSDLALRVQALETKLAEANLFTRTTDVEVVLDKARVIDALDSQEWFWDKIQNFVQVENLTDAQLAKIAGHFTPSDLVEAVDWSEHLDYSKIAGEIDLGDLANELDLEDLAGEIDLGDLAKELDADGIAEKIDVEEAVREFFANNTFSIRA